MNVPLKLNVCEGRVKASRFWCPRGAWLPVAVADLAGGFDPRAFRGVDRSELPFRTDKHLLVWLHASSIDGAHRYN
jgi:hypothetical protein